VVGVLSSVVSAPGLRLGLGHYVVLLGKTLLSRCLFPSRCINRYWRIYCWGEPCDGLASHPGGVEILLVATETRISSGLMSHLARM